MQTPPPPHHRLRPEQVSAYHAEGYLVFPDPVLPEADFAALRQTFESILAALPPGERPEAMDVPHFLHPQLLRFALHEEVLNIVEPILGPDLALFSTHFICKPRGHGKRVPWHEDSAYWRGQIEPMEVCTVWLAIDPSTRANGCMMVIPRTHREGRAGYSDYVEVDSRTSVFGTEIMESQRDDARRIHLELAPNQCSLHDARIMHGSEPNTSSLRRCGWTLRFCSTACRFNYERFDGMHVVYLARGQDRAGNHYADPARAHPEVVEKRLGHSRYKGSH